MNGIGPITGSELHHESIGVSTSGGLSASSFVRFTPPCGIGRSIYIEKVVIRTTLATTSDASNYWTIQLNVVSAAGSTTAAPGGTISTAADAPSATAIREHTINVNTVFDLTSAGRFELTLTKTLSPSNLVYVVGYSYRWV